MPVNFHLPPDRSNMLYNILLNVFKTSATILRMALFTSAGTMPVYRTLHVLPDWRLSTHDIFIISSINHFTSRKHFYSDKRQNNLWVSQSGHLRGFQHWFSCHKDIVSILMHVSADRGFVCRPRLGTTSSASRYHVNASLTEGLYSGRQSKNGSTRWLPLDDSCHFQVS